MLRRSLDIIARDVPALAERHMKLSFVQYAGKPCLRGADASDRPALVGRQRPGAGELDEEQVILNEVGAESCFRQRAFAELPHEGMADIAFPFASGRLLEAIEDIHGSFSRVKGRVEEGQFQR